MSKQLLTPVLLIVFNRIQLAQQVFDEIKKQRPKYLFIASDGPRKHIQGEAERNKECKALVEQVDWDCEVKTFFRDENVGAGKGVSSAINWFFEHVDEGIIFEEDCLPHSDFFAYCSELLEKYRNNERIMHISGDNFQYGIKRGEASYFFSLQPHIWGFATWKRAWSKYSFTMDDYSKAEFKEVLKKYYPSWKTRQVFMDKFLLTKRGEINSWDFQWMAAVWRYNGLAILPNVNLISNIGFSADALHCTDPNDPFANIPTQKIIPLIHPDKILINEDADNYYYNRFWYKSFPRIVYRILRRIYLLLTSDFRKGKTGVPF